MSLPFPTTPPARAGSLAAALAVIPEQRHPRGWRPQYAPIPLVALLQVMVAATLCGARSLYAIAQWAQERRQDDPHFLEDLGLPPGRSPSVATLHRVFKRLEVATFERVVGEWLLRTFGEPDEAIALDGKTLRGIHGENLPGVHLVSAYGHRSQVVLAQLRAPGKGQELAAVKQLLRHLPLEGRLVTLDALSTQRDISQQIVAGGGDYLLAVKENQPALLADLEAAFSPLGGPVLGLGTAAGAGLAVAGTGGAWRTPDLGGATGAKGAAWAVGRADGLDAV